MLKRTVLAKSLLIAFSGTAALVSGNVFAQQAPAPVQELQRVEITGSSIKRIDAETALPVTIIKREQIERSGATTTQDLISMIPQSFGGQLTAANVGSTGNPSTANLRGLGPKYTLVLLNGRRIANFAFGNNPVDLNTIPLSVIERVEVLRDGASAIYGADAIAGVINFITRKDYQGAEVAYLGSRTTQGGGAVNNFNLTAGYGDLATQRFNVMGSYNYEQDDVLKAVDRAFANTAVRPDLGINKSSPRNGIPNFSFSDTRGNVYGGTGTAPAVNPTRFSGCNAAGFGMAVIGSATCGTDYVKFIDLVPEAKHTTLNGRAVFQLDAANEIFLEGVGTKDSLVSTYSPAPYTKTMSYPAGGRFYPTSFTLPKGMQLSAGYIMPDGRVLTGPETLAADTVVTPTGNMRGTWRTVAGGGRTDLTENESQRWLLGAKGTIADWDYNTAYTYSKNKGTVSFGPGKFSYAALTPLVNAGSINVFGPQDTASQTLLDSALITGPEQSATSISQLIDFSMSKEVAKLPYGPLGIAFGGQYRKDTLNQISYPILETGDEVGGAGPIPSVSGDRKTVGLFAEATIPLYTGLELGLAARYDQYKNGYGSSFSSTSPKVALRFQPMAELLLRGSYGQGFVAPTMYENLRPFTSGNNTNANWSDPIRCPGGVPVTGPGITNGVGDAVDECNVQLATANQGNANLEPEKSTQYTLGFVFAPTNTFSMSVDYWDVTIKNAIVAKSEQQVLGDPTGQSAYYYRFDPTTDPDGLNPIQGNGPGATNLPLLYAYLPYENTAKFKAAGLDWNLTYRKPMADIGTVGVIWDATYYTRHSYQYNGVASVSDLGAYKDFGAVPKYRQVLAFTYSRAEWNGSLINNWTYGYQDYTNVTNPNLGTPAYPTIRNVTSVVTWDALVGWKAFKNFELSVGVKNLFNQDPPSSRQEGPFQVGYDAQYANPLGRQYYLRARYKFL